MSYSAKEVFATIQGEGINAGRPSVFIRFAGCDMWTGRDQDRAKGKGSCSAWCDTNITGTDGPGGGRYATAGDLADKAASLWPGDLHAARPRQLCVCTGGEPLLQLDGELVLALRRRGFEVAVETNGTRLLPVVRPDWVCVSPKAGAELLLTSGDELKLVHPQQGLDPAALEGLDFDHFVLQAMDGPQLAENMRLVVEYCMAHPRWRVGIQWHKVLGVP